MTPEHPASIISLAPPIIDKIAVTVPVDEVAKQVRTIEFIEELRRRQGFETHGPRFKRGYEHSLQIPIGAAGSILLQAQPTGNRVRQPAFARIEFNPAKVGSEGLSMLHTIAADLFPANYADLARVTRLDVAVDVHGAQITDLAVLSRRHQKSTVVYGRRGEIETIYLGTKTSGTQIIVYDKFKERSENQRILLDGPCTRFEVRIRTLKPLLEIAYLKNPFSRLEVFFGPSDASVGLPYERQMCCDSISRRGFPAFWKMLPVSKRKPYDRAISERRCAFWKPDEFWGGWGGTVEALGFCAEHDADSEMGISPQEDRTV